ncbi:hypothetical protein SDC9_164653 [bioreactor metagenome]|uniref:Uncharacterized protein n=1 Tax=bioreactor metagenome TaxID=1076179 RepID=A0A645FTQ7_9ZZZZ
MVKKSECLTYLLFTIHIVWRVLLHTEYVYIFVVDIICYIVYRNEIILDIKTMHIIGCNFYFHTRSRGIPVKNPANTEI